jgi:hypothetical protein
MSPFERFLKEGKARRSEPDITLSASLMKTAEDDLQFLKTIAITDLSSRKTFSNYYDVARSLLEALSAIEGYKVYSHEAYTDYLHDLKGEIELSEKFDRLRKIRNGVNYYGKPLGKVEAQELIESCMSLIGRLREMLKRE